METMKRSWVSPVSGVQQFAPQEYVANCVWRATLHCGVYGNSSYREGRPGNYSYVYEGMPHGEACQNTVVTVRQNKDGSLTVTGQEVPKGSLVTYAEEPEFSWGTRGTSAPGTPGNHEIGAIYSLATWNSTDINGTGEYKHTGYVATWEDYAGSDSNVS